MDAVKFLEIYSRMCSKYVGCGGCPFEGELLCQANYEKFSHEESERIVKIAEDWSRENPEEVGKKYIIEINDVDNSIYNCYHTNIGWISKSQLEQLEEYKGE